MKTCCGEGGGWMCSEGDSAAPHPPLRLWATVWVCRCAVA